MLKDKIHRVTDKSRVVRRYKILPYGEMAEILKAPGETVFFENSKELPLKRQTMWKAAKKLSEMVGKKVVAQRGVLKLNDSQALEGYLFSVVDQQPHRREDKRA